MGSNPSRRTIFLGKRQRLVVLRWSVKSVPSGFGRSNRSVPTILDDTIRGADSGVTARSMPAFLDPEHFTVRAGPEATAYGKPWRSCCSMTIQHDRKVYLYAIAGEPRLAA